MILFLAATFRRQRPVFALFFALRLAKSGRQFTLLLCRLSPIANDNG
jgi:hypothetical protein